MPHANKFRVEHDTTDAFFRQPVPTVPDADMVLPVPQTSIRTTSIIDWIHPRFSHTFARTPVRVALTGQSSRYGENAPAQRSYGDVMPLGVSSTAPSSCTKIKFPRMNPRKVGNCGASYPCPTFGPSALRHMAQVLQQLPRPYMLALPEYPLLVL